MCDLMKMAVILKRLLISRLFNMRYFYSCFVCFSIFYDFENNVENFQYKF